MSEGARLLGLLRRIRRRVRALAALEGALGGAALGLGLASLAVAVGRARGSAATTSTWRLGVAVVTVVAALGAAAAVMRRISLVRCARLLDAGLDRGDRPRDRALSALSFVDGPETPFSRAAITDALVRADRLAPHLVAPARRPRALPALGGAALILAVVGLFPARAPAARHDVGAPTKLAASSESRLRIGAELLESERDEARAAAQTATNTGDESLARLAEGLRAALDALAGGQLGRGEALDRLRDLARRAREAAEDAEQARAALRAAGQALERTAATRALGQALGADEPEVTERALRELAASATGSADGARASVARAFEAAAAAAGDVPAGVEDASPEGEARRRLRRDPAPRQGGDGMGGEAAARAGERRLERLRRDLDEAAAGCRGDAETCARQLRDGARALPRMQREAQDAPERRRLESAVRQLRERLQRGDLEPRGRGQTEKRFQRAARGQDPASGEGSTVTARARGASEAGGDPAMADADGDDDALVDEPGGALAGVSQGGEGADERAGAGDDRNAGPQAQGQGAGHEAGGEPLGRGSAPVTRGREREARVRGGAGPTRSEVIEASARRGFASSDYVRVFHDYQPVVEESLATAAVPEGQRYIVRRYFQLIRPRAAVAPRDAPAPRAP